MAESRSPETDGEDKLSSPLELPCEMKDWTADHVKQWILQLNDIDNDCAEILYQQDVNGRSLKLLEKSELLTLGIKLGPAKLIIHERDELVKQKARQLYSPDSQPGRLCKPYPFNCFHDAYRYKADSILDVTESGALDLIEPCHEYKAYNNFGNATQEEKMSKFTDEAIRFAAACMNSRTNGTIHFGVGDLPDYKHGQILGVSIQDKEAFVKSLPKAIEGHFEHKHTETAKKCIKPPRFVEVLNHNMTSSQNYVIEVDIEPSTLICRDDFFHVYSVDTRKSKRKSKQIKAEEKEIFFYIRDNSSSRNLLVQSAQSKASGEYEKYNKTQLTQQRKNAEEKHITVAKNSVQGSKLCEMLTGSTHSLDKSYFERYVMVVNKSHPVQLDSLAFLLEMNWTAILDFDPESHTNGLNTLFQDQKINVHIPAQYKITEAVEDIARKLKLTRNTSWVFCNGGVNGETPSHRVDWLMEKGSSVRDVISFLCRKDVLPHKKFLVVFLLLSDVIDNKDPLVETFGTFLQELKGTGQILCICENERSYTYWKDVIEARYGINISQRCISELSFAEINGTVLSLWSSNRRSSRFLPCGGGGRVLLTKKVESTLDALNILCVNQCEGGNENKMQLEENFYKGGKVSWWNFYFSEEPGSMPFIKRDKFDYIIDTIIPEMCSLRQACVHFNILHIPGCGGTTLAMHILWTFKDKFRCAVLRDRTVDSKDVASQVVQLLTHETSEQSSRPPVLLMIDDFEETDAVFELQQHIEKEVLKRNIGSKCPEVIILNCMRAETWVTETETTEDTVFIGHKLSETEQKLFQKKLEEIEKIYKNADTFYGFMIMKKNFSQEYIRGVVKNTLKSFNLKNKEAQLIAVMVLLAVYSNNAKLSVPLCEEFLGMQTNPNSQSCKIEDGFGKFSTLLTQCTVEAEVVFEALRLIHRSMAKYCLEELSTTYSISKAEITNLLLTNEMFYECIQGKDTLIRNVHDMLVKRFYSLEGEDSQFSPLIQAISKETPGFEETVLFNAAKRFEKDAVMSQLLSRYHYLKKKDFREAKDWAKKAKDLSRDNSYISDTSAQVIKHELKNAIGADNNDPIKPDKLREYLKMAVSATDAFKETQAIAKKESLLRYQGKRDYTPYNTAGCLGEIQVGIIVMGILEKIPVFNANKLDRLSQFLAGKLKVQDLAKKDPVRHIHASYYQILKEVEEFLYNLKDNMKKHFDFLDCFYVNLEPFFYQKDIRDERIKKELFRCFQQYANLFCKLDQSELHSNWGLTHMYQQALNLERIRQCIEMNKADTHSGLLEYLSNKASASKVERIVQQYHSILQIHQHTVRDMVNLIYANVILCCVKPGSRLILPFGKLLKVLMDVLRNPVPHSESLALNFISVVLLWPELNSVWLSQKLRSFVSQMRSAFSNEMKSVYKGKRPTVHFYLGKRTGYARLICQNDIMNAVGTGQNIPSQQENGKIWKHLKVQALLRRVTGEVSEDFILANTSIPELKIEVSPRFKSQLSGNRGKIVSFFIGFSMNGPVAFDIEF